MKAPRLAPLLALVAASSLWVASTPAARASLPAFDSAADSAYDTGWNDGSNGGFGFTPWRIESNADATHSAGTFIGDAGASGVNPAINTNGRAFGMYANVPPNTSGASVSAQRDFTGGTLQPGESFTLQIAINYRDGSKGVILSGASPFGNALGAFSTGGFPHTHSLSLYDHSTLQTVNYTTYDYYPDSLFTVRFTMVSLTLLQADLWRTTSALGFEHLTTLTANSPATASGFNLFYGSTAQSAPELDLFFNNFAVVPEPSSFALLVVGSLAGLHFLRRRSRP